MNNIMFTYLITLIKCLKTFEKYKLPTFTQGEILKPNNPIAIKEN